MVPNLFRKYPLPIDVPEELMLSVGELKSCSDKEQCLKRAYEIVIDKYRGGKILTYLRFKQIFVTDLKKIWSRSGFLHCTTCNYLLRFLLVKSDWFSEDDVELRYSLIWYLSIHQYLRVRITENNFINIDPWSAIYGIEFGDYARGFHC